MAFVILNQGSAGNSLQAEPDSVDLDILVAGYSGSGVISGCAPTAQGTPDLTVAIATGVVLVAGVRTSVTGANATISTADTTNPRFDLISINSSGTIVTTAGTAAAIPEFPAIPATSVALAAIFVPASDTAIATNQITDKRVILLNVGAGGVGDDILLRLGDDGDIALLNRSTSLSANTTLTSVVEGTAATFATAANSLIISNITDDGDVHIMVSKGGNSHTAFLADGSTGDTYVNASTGQVVNLAIAGTAEVAVSGAAFYPVTDDGQILGILNTNEWSDLFLASGGVIGWNNNDVTLTHSANTLTLGGGNFVGTLGAITLGGAVDAGNQAITNVNIDSGVITGITDLALADGGTGASLADPGADRFMFWDDSETAVAFLTAGNGLTITTTTIAVDTATTSVDGIAELATVAETNTGTDTGRVCTPDSISGAIRTIVLTAAGGAPLTTAGCAGPTQVEAATNDINYWVLDFDTTTEEHAAWNVVMPASYDGGVVNATFYWTNSGGGAGETVDWGIAALALADDGAIDQALGTEVTTTDTYIAQGDLHVSGASGDITIAGSPAGGQWVEFTVARKVASDDLTGDARLMAVVITYTIDQYSD